MMNERRKAEEQRFIDQQRTITFKHAFFWFFKRLIIFSILIIYTVIGAYIFQALESDNELQQCRSNEERYRAMEDATVEKLWSVGLSYWNNVEQSVFDEALKNDRSIVHQYAEDVISFNGGGYDGRNCSLMGTADGVDYSWSLFGSMLFAITIFTTVGYGNIAPKTNWGRVMVFVYAMIGIPYMLVCVAMIGEVMADVFRFVYFELCCCGLCARRARRRRRQRDAGEGRRRENQLTDPPSLSQLYQDEMSRTRNQQAPTVVDDYDDLLDEEDPAIGIPLTFTLLVVIGYILMGAAIFGVWENWSAMKAAYFCFVTISTIGFGDVVPGVVAGILSRGDALLLVIDSIYIVLGLAIVAMAFNLIQENMANKMKMLEDKLSGSPKDENAETMPAAVVQPAAPLATVDESGAIPYGAGKQPPTRAQNETSFTKNRPPTASSTYHGARPKTPNTGDDDDKGPTSRRTSLDLPHIAQ